MMSRPGYTLTLRPIKRGYSWLIKGPTGKTVARGRRQGTREEVLEHLRRPLHRFNNPAEKSSEFLTQAERA